MHVVACHPALRKSRKCQRQISHEAPKEMGHLAGTSTAVINSIYVDSRKTRDMSHGEQYVCRVIILLRSFPKTVALYIKLIALGLVKPN